MDAVQFGRWISERRRKYGWHSQRSLAEAARHDPLLSEYRISEDFLSRLEAGRLVHPFRGAVRKQVLSLAWLLCKTQRDVHTYLQAAEIADLSADDTEQLQRLNDYLATRHNPVVSLLPARPMRLVGRTPLVHELINHLCTLETGLCSLTGMPGVGKSALAYEIVHLLASNARLHVFPDGIATFSCTGRRGRSGLIALLHEIVFVFSARSEGSLLLPTLEEDADDLAGAIDRARIALADKSVLLLLDNLDAQFPLRQILDALLGSPHSRTCSNHRERATKRSHRVVLTTSRHIPSASLVSYHAHVQPLDVEAACELFVSLLGNSPAHLSRADRVDVQRICAALGYLPLAIEVAAHGVSVKGIPLSLLAASAVDYPLNSLLDGDDTLRSLLDEALDAFNPRVQRQFALLAALDVQSFGLESVAAMSTLIDMPLPNLARAAADLGQLVSHSFLELVTNAHLSGNHRVQHYRLHPLLHAYAISRMERLEPELVCVARRNIQSYAEAYLGDIIQLERERDFSLATLQPVWPQGQYTKPGSSLVTSLA